MSLPPSHRPALLQSGTPMNHGRLVCPTAAQVCSVCLEPARRMQFHHIPPPCGRTRPARASRLASRPGIFPSDAKSDLQLCNPRPARSCPVPPASASPAAQLPHLLFWRPSLNHHCCCWSALYFHLCLLQLALLKFFCADVSMLF